MPADRNGTLAGLAVFVIGDNVDPSFEPVVVALPVSFRSARVTGDVESQRSTSGKGARLEEVGRE